uniref:DNA-directed DNA polymerase n=1 Tax=Meloidogyne enterolobii TaxID=390850 RepID=A0A6V7XJB4_MELEN|nr:unnamed protein product [Meloidogyne enterolobii]
MRNYFVIERIEPFASQSRNTRGEIAHIRFNNLADHPRPDLALTTLIEQLLDRVLTGRPAPLRVGLQVQPPNFHHPFTVPLRPVEQNNAAALAAAIERLNEISQAGIDLLSGTTTTKVVAVICEACIRANIRIEHVGQRAQGCFCGTPRGERWRNWCFPPFKNAPGDNTAFPNNITFNHRRMFFHSFDNAEDNPVDQFLDYLLNHGSQHMLTICIAHNGGKYDFHLLLEALHRRSHPPTRICTTGLKIYSMSLRGNNQRKVLFKDSLTTFFDLVTAKPFFPYLFIQRQHLHDRLRGLPAIQYYQPEYKKAEKREKLIEWYTQQTSVQTTTTNFQLREQLIIYCVNDVAILRESVLRFRQLIGENTKNLDPFLTVSTAAGLALTTMRRCFLPENWLVHSPEGGYLRGRRASAESQRYIRFFELQHPESAGHIQHAQWALGEAHVEDCGLSQMLSCPKCFPAGRTAEELFERTQQRLWELEHRHGYQLHVVWGMRLKKS